MTTPEVEIVMPYGITVESKPGDRMMKPVKDHPKRFGTSSLSLVDGPCRVAASYRGPEGGLLQLVNGNSVTVIGKIPSGGAGVRQVMATVGAKEGDVVRIYLDTAPTAENTGTIEVFPTNFEQ